MELLSVNSHDKIVYFHEKKRYTEMALYELELSLETILNKDFPNDMRENILIIVLKYLTPRYS